MLSSCTNCKAEFNLKEELLGKTVECPNCKTQFIVSEGLSSEVVKNIEWINWPTQTTMTEKWIFGKNKYGIKQKKIAINEKYYVKDENNNDLFFSVRRIHFWRRLWATLLWVTIFLGSIAFGYYTWFSISESMTVGITSIIISWLIGLFLLIFIMSIAGRRDIEFYLSEADMDKNDSEFTIHQDNLYELVHKTYTLKRNGVEIAKFDKNIFTDILRKKWHMYYNGKHILVKEESVILGIMRRLGVPFIRTNFIFIDITSDPKSINILGYFKRKFEIFDNYLLDMTSDPSFIIPREIAICMAILLDCGERR
jgi:DNA-directed RNA polymerase subunit RPC12/RpoP